MLLRPIDDLCYPTAYGTELSIAEIAGLDQDKNSEPFYGKTVCVFLVVVVVVLARLRLLLVAQPFKYKDLPPQIVCLEFV